MYLLMSAEYMRSGWLSVITLLPVPKQLSLPGSVCAVLGSGQLSTYNELCSLASDLNQPDLVYKFMQLSNHNAAWNSRRGAAFGFSSIAARAGQALTPHLGKIVPKLYRSVLVQWSEHGSLLLRHWRTHLLFFFRLDVATCSQGIVWLF